MIYRLQISALFLENIQYIIQTVTKSGTEMWDLGLDDSGTPQHQIQGRRDNGMWDSGILGRRDAGMRGHGTSIPESRCPRIPTSPSPTSWCPWVPCLGVPDSHVQGLYPCVPSPRVLRPMDCPTFSYRPVYIRLVMIFTGRVNQTITFKFRTDLFVAPSQTELLTRRRQLL